MANDRFVIAMIAGTMYEEELAKKLGINPHSGYGRKRLNEYLEEERKSDELSAEIHLRNSNPGKFISYAEIRSEASRIKKKRLEPYVEKAKRKQKEQSGPVLEKTDEKPYKKYLGIIKIYKDYMSGTQIKMLSKTYDDPNLLNIWFNMYPNSEHLLIENTQELNEMFEPFKDMTPITEEEQKSMENAKLLYEELMNDSNEEKEQNGPVFTKKKTLPINTGNK